MARKTVTIKQDGYVNWPLIRKDDIKAVVRNLTMKNFAFYGEAFLFEEEFRKYIGAGYALAEVNGTAALQAAYFAMDIQPGDEIIMPSYTYWASNIPALAFGAKPVFAEVDPATLNIDPKDIAKKITRKTKAVTIVHWLGLPCEMDEIMNLARKHNILVIEDASHAHGATYKGKKIGAFGDMAAFSFQASKVMPGIEAGIFLTNNREYYERAVALGHYERLKPNFYNPAGVSIRKNSPYHKYCNTSFGFKHRMNPMSAALLRSQLRKLARINRDTNRNMDYLAEELDAVRGISAIKTPKDRTRAYYGFRLRYDEAETGISIDAAVKKLQAEGVLAAAERYPLQHNQPLYYEKCFAAYEPLKKKPSLPVTEEVVKKLISIPVFHRPARALCRQYVRGFVKVLGRKSI